MARITQETLDWWADALMGSQFSAAARMFCLPLPVYDASNVLIFDNRQVVAEKLATMMATARMLGVRELSISVDELREDGKGSYVMDTCWHHPGTLLPWIAESSRVTLYCQDSPTDSGHIRMIDLTQPLVPLLRLLDDRWHMSTS